MSERWPFAGNSYENCPNSFSTEIRTMEMPPPDRSTFCSVMVTPQRPKLPNTRGFSQLSAAEASWKPSHASSKNAGEPWGRKGGTAVFAGSCLLSGLRMCGNSY